jgi:hypothetical protein
LSGEGRAVDWGLLERLIRRLAQRIEASGYSPDIVIGLGERGWVFARLLSDHLGVSDLITIGAEASIDIERISSLELGGKRILLAFDIEEAGDALEEMLKNLERIRPSEVRTATLLLPGDAEITTLDYYGFEGGGVIYPWELHRGSMRRRAR